MDEAEAEGDGALEAHIMKTHKQEIQEVALVEEEYVWDVYREALAVQERRAVPAVGPAVDRRAFEATQGRYNDDNVQALICFVCARICLNTGGARSDIAFRKGTWLAERPAGLTRAQSRGKSGVLRSTVQKTAHSRSSVSQREEVREQGEEII